MRREESPVVPVSTGRREGFYCIRNPGSPILSGKDGWAGKTGLVAAVRALCMFHRIEEKLWFAKASGRGLLSTDS